MKISVTMLLTCLLAACSTTPKVDAIKPEDSTGIAERRALMLGTWFGDTETKEGGRRMHIVDRYTDGTMRIRFRIIKADGSIFEQQEVAIWGIAGPIYFSATQGFVENNKMLRADTSDPHLYDAYEILELDEDTFRYRHVDNGNEYEIDKVDSSFDFPI